MTGVFTMHSALFVGLGLVIVLVISRLLAERSGLPYPVLLVVAGAAASFVPDMPTVQLDPKLVFLGFLPPLVYHAGSVTSPRGLRANALPIGLGALGLVLVTTFAVAGAVWAVVPALGFVGAFVLGAVVAPTDPVAATSVLARLGGPVRLTTILEGESLVNDGVALSLFTLGLAAMASGTSAVGDLTTFGRLAVGGTAFGLIVGFVGARVRRPLRDPAAELVVSLLMPYAAYLPAAQFGLSGVLAALTAGLVLGQDGLHGLDPAGRVRLEEFWSVLVFLLESVLFVLVGFQLRTILSSLDPGQPAQAATMAAVTVAAVVGVRILWWLAVPTLRWRPEAGRIIDTGGVPWQSRLVLGWSGLRGAISLAAALSIPVVVGGHRFPLRNLVVFAAFCTVIVTLLGQGTTLSWLLRRLGLVGGDDLRHERVIAVERMTEVALVRLDELAADVDSTGATAVDTEVIDMLRQTLERRLFRAQAQLGIIDPATVLGRPLVEVRRELAEREREALAQMYRAGELGFAVFRQLRHELDLEQASLDGR